MYTKGEWQVNNSSYDDTIKIDTDDHRIAKICLHWNPTEETRANARLIAAAPRLLEACEDLQRAVIRVEREYTNEEEEAIQKVNAVIGKIEGRKIIYTKGDEVVLIKLPVRGIDRLKVGMVGVVLGVRTLIDPPQVLIKFKGKSGPVSVYENEIERRT